ncbi:MAG: hypothetical protein CVT70_18095 [Alphaproteobacteria bacterium HGW-Alphaproteobacteria-1]|nr:MAG: hypothetical protein CVT70_18095 [Alphaproteobacteria bacterium HGW-Alphaproteobacteria-1]
MKLPQREFYTLHEVAARWGCALADIAGWSAAGQLDVITGIPPTVCGSTTVSGTVVICTMDIVPMFRRCGTGPTTAQLRRLRTEDATDWLFVTDPPEGVDVSIADLFVRSKQVMKFEDTHDLLRRVSGGTGSTSPYDWDGMTKAFLIRIHDHGIPASKAEMISDIQDWFVTNSNGDDIPSERSIRRHVDDLRKTLSELRQDENA